MGSFWSSYRYYHIPPSDDHVIVHDVNANTYTLYLYENMQVTQKAFVPDKLGLTLIEEISQPPDWFNTCL